MPAFSLALKDSGQVQGSLRPPSAWLETRSGRPGRWAGPGWGQRGWSAAGHPAAAGPPCALWLPCPPACLQPWLAGLVQTTQMLGAKQDRWVTDRVDCKESIPALGCMCQPPLPATKESRTLLSPPSCPVPPQTHTHTQYTHTHTHTDCLCLMSLRTTSQRQIIC